MRSGRSKIVAVQISLVAALVIFVAAPLIARAAEPGSGVYAADCGNAAEAVEVEISSDGSATIAKGGETYAGLLTSYSFFGKATPPDFHIALLFDRNRSPFSAKDGGAGRLEIWKGEAAFYALPNGDRQQRLYFCGEISASAPKEPAFECGKSESPVEKLICRDKELARRDWALAAIYRKALGRLSNDDTRVRVLEADHANWVKARNDCRTAEDIRACVAAQYADRHAMLLARFGLIEAGRTQVWICGPPDRELHVTDFMTEPPTINLVMAGQSATAILRRAASGVRYEAPDGVEFWIKGAQAQLEWPRGTRIECRFQGPLEK